MGRVCGLDLFHGILSFLVYGSDPRLGDYPRSLQKLFFSKFFYGLFSLGWTGSNRHWRNYEKAYLLLAGLSTPLVLSSAQYRFFRLCRVSGAWMAYHHIFPPYFVAGAIFSGFGMVLTLMIPLRSIFKLREPAHRPTSN